MTNFRELYKEKSPTPNRTKKQKPQKDDQLLCTYGRLHPLHTHLLTKHHPRTPKKCTTHKKPLVYGAPPPKQYGTAPHSGMHHFGGSFNRTGGGIGQWRPSLIPKSKVRFWFFKR